jgi:hypothetical protein
MPKPCAAAKIRQNIGLGLVDWIGQVPRSGEKSPERDARRGSVSHSKSQGAHGKRGGRSRFCAAATLRRMCSRRPTGAAVGTGERKSLVAIASWSTLAASAAIARWLHPVTRFVHIEHGGCVSGAPRRRACRGAPPTRARAASPLVRRRRDLLRAQQRVEGKRLLTAAAGAGWRGSDGVGPQVPACEFTDAVDWVVGDAIEERA